MKSSTDDLSDSLAKLDAVFKDIEKEHFKTLSPYGKNAVLKLKEVHQILRKETERGCVLVGAAFLDEKLKELINKVATGSNKAKKELFDAMGPLGSLSAKINLAYCFGLISQEARHDLHTIREIRNKFAHLSVSMSLRDEQFANKLKNLKLPAFINLGVMPRLAFTTCVGAIAGEINQAIEETEQIQARSSTFAALGEEINRPTNKMATKRKPYKTE